METVLVFGIRSDNRPPNSISINETDNSDAMARGSGPLWCLSRFGKGVHRPYKVKVNHIHLIRCKAKATYTT